MTEAEFHNALRVLRCIDAPELREAGVTPSLIGGFLDWPHDCFIRMSDKDRADIWGIVERRMKFRAEAALKRLLDAHDPEECVIRTDPDPGCIECTHWTVPDHSNTGLCPLHEGRAALAKAGAA